MGKVAVKVEEGATLSLYQATKWRVRQVLAITDPDDPATRAVGYFITTLILLNVLALVLITVESLSAAHGQFFWYFEMISMGIFTVEYILRIWSCTSDTRYCRPIMGRLRYAVTPFALIDLLSIAPFYIFVLPGVSKFNGTFIRLLRLFRLSRLWSTSRYVRSMGIVWRVLKAKKEEIVMAFLVIALLLIFLSTAMYLIEGHHDHPNGGEFSSIPAALWWGVATLTTVGYGDMVPITVEGKVIGAIVSLLGIAIFALPAGILASGFAEEVRAARHASRPTCPHCGREME
jgi:voltage-gated potassium channel